MHMLRRLRIRISPRRSSTGSNDDHNREGASESALVVLIQSLKFAAAAAAVTSVPFLKGSIGIALAIAECAKGYKSNQKSMQQLALRLGRLMLDITEQLNSDPEVSDALALLVADLFKTAQEANVLVETMSSRHRALRYLIQQEDREKINDIYRDIADAHLKFQTMFLIAKDKSDAAQDHVYRHGDIELGTIYEGGVEWVAFMAKLSDSGQNILVKRYTSDDISKRKMMYSCDLRAFKKAWYPNVVEYMGGSHPREEHPFIVLRGVTYDHVSDYIAQRFSEDNQRGSAEALKMLTDLTNALSYLIGTTDSPSFDISKVRLTDSRKVVVVDLEPCLETSRKSKNDMPYWRRWTEVCIELLSGDPAYEPNPVIVDHADPAQHARLEYLRPILGHIHSGGLRFKGRIESAFRRQGLLLAQSHRKLERLPSRTINEAPTSPDDLLLRSLWHRSRELHYVAHFRDPLEVDIGDIGYITGNPPQFTRLENAYHKLSDGKFPHSNPPRSRFLPLGRWTTEVVQGVVRHAFRFRDSDALELENWHTQRPRLDKDFKLRRINLPQEEGLVVDCAQAWHYLADCATDLAANYSKRPIRPSDLILVVYFKQQSGYATFRMNGKDKVDPNQWHAAWAREGFDIAPEVLYFYESPPGGTNGVWGYFSFSPIPGTPHPNWTPERDDEGESWGWTFVSEDWTVEISKPNIKQYIRYVQL